MKQKEESSVLDEIMLLLGPTLTIILAFGFVGQNIWNYIFLPLLIINIALFIFVYKKERQVQFEKSSPYYAAGLGLIVSGCGILLLALNGNF